MKELSIEEKARRYDEAIKLAKDSFNYPDYTGFIRADVVFPELKESEDERIRKALLEHFITFNQEDNYLDGIPFSHVVAWLEKKGERKHQYKSRPRYVGEEELLGTNKQCPFLKQELIDKGFAFSKDGGLAYPIHIKMQGEQKSVEWSEKDETGWTNTMIMIKECASNHYTKDSIKLVIDWLNSLKHRCFPQPNQEWSEEDEAMWAEISDLLWEGYKQSGSKFSWDNIRSWVNPKLKSLIPQNRWKPSDEQMENLSRAFNGGVYRTSLLFELYQDLKKLKG